MLSTDQKNENCNYHNIIQSPIIKLDVILRNANKDEIEILLTLDRDRFRSLVDIRGGAMHELSFSKKKKKTVNAAINRLAVKTWQM